MPLRLYISRGKAKIELGLARGKQLHDRRRDIADRDAKRDIERELADVQRGAAFDAAPSRPLWRRIQSNERRMGTASAQQVAAAERHLRDRVDREWLPVERDPAVHATSTSTAATRGSVATSRVSRVSHGPR